MTRVVPTTARERDRKQAGLRCCRYLRLLRASRFDRFILGRPRELTFESGLLQRGVSNEPCGRRRVARGWDPEFESALLQRGVRNEPSPEVMLVSPIFGDLPILLGRVRIPVRHPPPAKSQAGPERNAKDRHQEPQEPDLWSGRPSLPQPQSGRPRRVRHEFSPDE